MMLENACATYHVSRSVNPTTRQLLSERVQHSFKERGVNPLEVLKEIPKETKHEMTPEEIKKLERKRLKNRLHAKQSRERRNWNFTKTERENNILKMEIKILRKLITISYKQQSGVDLSWSKIEVEDPLVSCSPPLNNSLEFGRFYLKLPADIIEKLSTDVLGPYKPEDILGYIGRLESCDMMDSMKEEVNSISPSSVAIDIPTNVPKNEPAYASYGGQLPLHSNVTSPDYGDALDEVTDGPVNPFCQLGVEPTVSNILGLDFDIVDSMEHTDFGESFIDCTLNPVDKFEDSDIGNSYLVNVENDAKGQSPWMVDYKLDKTPLDTKHPLSYVRNPREKLAFASNPNQPMKQEIGDQLNNVSLCPSDLALGRTLLARPLTDSVINTSIHKSIHRESSRLFEDGLKTLSSSESLDILPIGLKQRSPQFDRRNDEFKKVQRQKDPKPYLYWEMANEAKTTRESNTDGNPGNDIPLFSDIPRRKHVTQSKDEQQCDPVTVSNLSSLNLEDMIFEEAEFLEPTFQLLYN